jgi:serine/threonine protein kinase
MIAEFTARRLDLLATELDRVRAWRPGGSLSELFVGIERRTRREVVVKFPRTDLEGPYWRPAFARERALTEVLTGSGAVVPVSGSHHRLKARWTAEAGCPAPLVTQRFGTDLKAWRECADGERIQRVWTALLGAVARLHTSGIVHRDVRPDNAVTDGERVRLIDLTFARELHGPPLISEEHAFYRYARPLTYRPFAPPEAFLGMSSAPDAWRRADVYALGVSLHVLWTGRTPARVAADDELLDQLTELFLRCEDVVARRRNAAVVLRALAENHPVPSLDGVPGPDGTFLPSAVCDLVQAMCAIEPRHRPEASAAVKVLGEVGALS